MYFTTVRDPFEVGKSVIIKLVLGFISTKWLEDHVEKVTLYQDSGVLIRGANYHMISLITKRRNKTTE
jgi:hypothetical protein